MGLDKTQAPKKASQIIANAGIMPDVVVGGAAGNHTLTGITVEDRLLKVTFVKLALAEGTPNTITWTTSDLTSEFRGASTKGVTADDTISNPGGTDTSDGILLVFWQDVDRDNTSEGFYPEGGSG